MISAHSHKLMLQTNPLQQLLPLYSWLQTSWWPCPKGMDRGISLRSDGYLWDASCTVSTSNVLDVTSSMFWAATVSSFLCLSTNSEEGTKEYSNLPLLREKKENHVLAHVNVLVSLFIINYYHWLVIQTRDRAHGALSRQNEFYLKFKFYLR